MADYLDYRTLAIVLTAKCFFQAFGLGYVWHVHRKFAPARDWAVGSVLVAFGTFLLALYPDSTSAVLVAFRSALIYSGMLIIVRGLIRTCGSPVPWRLFSVLVISALCADVWYTHWVPSMSARAVVFSLVVVVGEIYVAIAALNAPPGPLRGTQRLIAALLMLQCAASIFRIFVGSGTELGPAFQSMPSQVVFLFSTVATAFLLSLLLVVLTSQHMNALLAATIDNLNQGVAMFDAEQKLIICNERYGEIYGLDATQVKPGTSLATIIKRRIEKGIFSGRSPAEYFRERTAPVLDASASMHELNDGRCIAVSRRPVQSGGWVTTHEDVTAFRRIESQLAYMAHHDALTGLANRPVFLQKIDEGLTRLRSGEEFCVLLLDLDRFKAVNDSFGHPVGDALLKVAAFRLRSCTRSTDTIARLGGDEFAIIRTDIAGSYNEISALANRILRSISAPYDLDGHRITIGTSIGISLAPHDATDPDQLMQKADLALYRAKAEGRNGYRFHTCEMDAKSRVRVAIEQSLRKADLGEDFLLGYDPLVDGRSGYFCGAAASALWRGPDGHLVDRAEMMDLAEDRGLSARLGTWMLRKACAEAASLPLNFEVAVDLLPSQFADAMLPDVVATALAASGLSANRLVLRVTEACLMQDGPSPLAILQGLKALGISITLADFGAGTHSLRQLLAFPYDHVVIDETLVGDIAWRSDAATIVAAITGFAASLGVATIAQGVATQEQFEILNAAGCRQFRGPLFGVSRTASEMRSASFEAKVA